MMFKSPTTSSPHGKKTTGFQNKLKILLGTICCFLFIFVIVLSLPVYLFRFLVIMLAKIFRPDLGKIFNGISSYLVNDYFYNKKSPRANIVVSVYLNGRDMTIEELKENLMEKWINAKDSTTGKPKFEQFQQYPERWLGFTFFKSCANTFDINNHVYIHDQPNNKNDFVDDEDVNNICEKLLNSHYKPFTSPWEVHLVKNYKSDKTKTMDSNEKSYVVIFKLHHCLADGYSILIALIEALFQQYRTNIKLPEPKYPKRTLGQKIFYYISFPFRFMYDFSDLLSHIFRTSPWKIPNEKKEWYQHCAKSEFIPIEKVKFIKSKLGVSFTSVLLYSISSAIHKTLQNAKNKDLLTSQFKSYFEEEDNVKSMYCMSLLPLPGRSGGLTNHVTMSLFDLPTGNSGSVVNGLREVDYMLETTKNSTVPVFVPLYLAAVGCHFYPIGNFIGKQRTHHISLSNFPSLPIQLEQDKRKCIGVDFLSGGLDGVAGAVVQVLSYNEYIRMAITAEKAILSKDEITKFTTYMVDEINHLYKEASVKCNGGSKARICNLYADGKIESLHTLLPN